MLKVYFKKGWKICSQSSKNGFWHFVKKVKKFLNENFFFVFLLPQCDDQHHLLDYCKNVKNAFVVICQVTNLSLSLCLKTLSSKIDLGQKWVLDDDLLFWFKINHFLRLNQCDRLTVCLTNAIDLTFFATEIVSIDELVRVYNFCGFSRVPNSV